MRVTPWMAAVPGMAVVLGLAACDKPAEPQAEAAPRPVRVQAVVLTQPQRTLTYSGTIQARRQVELAFRVGGKVVARPVDLGARVQRGDVLAQLDPSDLQLQAEAAQNAVAAAAADAANARAELRRYETMGRNSPAYLVSENDRRSAMAAMAGARLEQAQRQYALAQSQQGYRILEADADGVVAALPVEVGQVVAAGQPVATVAHTAETEVLVDVPENRVAEVRAATDIRVAAWAGEGEAPGRIREVAARADPASRTFAVRIAVDNSQDRLALGGTATVRFTGAGQGQVALLPAATLSDQGGSPAVWVLDAGRGRAVLRPVKVLGYQGDVVAIGAGLEAGEQVVTAGVTGLDPALPVMAWAGAER